jgi:putative PIN family toxin of toxin-antitoxin system
MRVVLDTNVLVSALLAPNGNEAVVVRLALSGKFETGVSPAILTEYYEDLGRPRFKFSRVKLDIFFDRFLAQGTMVHPRNTVAGSNDSSDNRFLECAETIRANYLITGNLRHFPAVWKATRILNAREFMEQAVPI